MTFKKILLLALLSVNCSISQAQNIEEIALDKGFQVSGSINLNSVSYYVHGIEQRRDPFNWFLTGNVNLSLFGYQAPFSFSYSNADKNYSQPFNQFSFQPQYKWIRAYIGYNSMTFSNYTLAGHVFFGGGVELTPGKWRLAVMYGRLKKAVSFSQTDTLQLYNASFKRMGYGLKVGYESDGGAFYFNVFAAQDERRSIPFVLPESNLTPMQNVAMSLRAKKTFLKRLFAEFEYAVSVLNKDTRVTDGHHDTTAYTSSRNFIEGLLPENATNRYFDAINASIGYTGDWYSVQVKYERVAPEYQTLGAYFFNNDLRNITFAPAIRLLKNTLNISANGGFQVNNLNEERTSTTKRTVGSLNLNYAPNELWNFTGNYSNFSTYTNIRPQTDPFFKNTLDTLNFYQVNQTTNVGILRTFKTGSLMRSIMMNAAYQKATDRAAYASYKQQGSEFVTISISYSLSHQQSGSSLALAGNMYRSSVAGSVMTYWGPTVNMTKVLLEKTLRASWAGSYNVTSSKIKTSPVLNNRLALVYTPKPKDAGGKSNHNVTVGINLLNRLQNVAEQKKYAEITGTVNYTFSF